ncbi:MAG: hypothetical protein ACRDAM_22635, partial [Casimicrobium sp.]
MFWRFKHWGPDGTAKPDIGMFSKIVSLDRFDVDPHGNCLEGNFSGLISALGIGHLDVLCLEFRPNATAPYVPLYRGEARVPGSRKSLELSQVQLVGLSERLEDCDPPSAFGVYAGKPGAIAGLLMARVVASGAIGTVISSDMTLIDVATGPNITSFNPLGSSVKACLEFLAASAGMVWGVG